MKIRLFGVTSVALLSAVLLTAGAVRAADPEKATQREQIAPREANEAELEQFSRNYSPTITAVVPATRLVVIEQKKIVSADVFPKDGEQISYSINKILTEYQRFTLSPDVSIIRMEHGLKAGKLRVGDMVSLLGQRVPWDANKPHIVIRVPDGAAPIKMTEAMFNSLEIRRESSMRDVRVISTNPLQFEAPLSKKTDAEIALAEDAEFDRVSQLSLEDLAVAIEAKLRIEVTFRMNAEGKREINGIKVFGTK